MASLAAISCGRPKGTGFDGYAFVANQGGQSVGAIDLNTFTLARYIPVEGQPAALAVDPERPAVYALCPDNGLLHHINTASLSVARKLRLCQSAVSMRFAPDGLWVLSRQPRALVRIDPVQFKPNLTIGLPSEPAQFDLSPDGKSAAVTFAGVPSFGIVDLEKRRCQSFDAGNKVSLVAYRADGLQIMLGGAGERMLTIADAVTGRLIVRLPLAVEPRHFCYKADGGQLFITGPGMDAVVIVYPYRTEVGETVLAGRAPGFIAECITSDVDYLFIANPDTSELTIMDIDMRRVIAVVAVGRRPVFVAFTPDLQYALVLNSESGDMAVIRIPLITARRDRSGALFTMVPVGTQPVSAVIRRV